MLKKKIGALVILSALSFNLMVGVVANAATTVVSTVTLDVAKSLVTAKLDTTSISEATSTSDILALVGIALDGDGIVYSVASFNNTNNAINASIYLKDSNYNTTVVNYSRTYSATNTGNTNAGNAGSTGVLTLATAQVAVTTALNNVSLSSVTTQSDIASLVMSTLSGSSITYTMNSFKNSTGILTVTVGLKDSSYSSAVVNFSKAYGITDSSASDLITYVKDNLNEDDYDSDTSKSDLKDSINKLLGNSGSITVTLSDFANNKSTKKITCKLTIEDNNNSRKYTTLNISYSSNSSNSDNEAVNDAISSIENYLDDYVPKNNDDINYILEKLKQEVNNTDTTISISGWKISKASNTSTGMLSFGVNVKDTVNNADSYYYEKNIPRLGSSESTNAGSTVSNSNSKYQLTTTESSAVSKVSSSSQSTVSDQKDWTDTEGNVGTVTKLNKNGNIVGSIYTIKSINTNTATITNPTNIKYLYKYDSTTGTYVDLTSKVTGTANTLRVSAVVGDIYYLSDSSLNIVKEGWVQESGSWVYYQNNSKLSNKWIKNSSGKWYYVSNNGTMSTGWIGYDGKYYYLDTASGEMSSGWKYINGNWYYFGDSGVMVSGWMQSSGKWYFLGSNGSMLYSTSVNGYTLGSDGAMI